MRRLTSQWGQETEDGGSFPVEKQIRIFWISCGGGDGDKGHKAEEPTRGKACRGDRAWLAAGTAWGPSGWRVVTQG